MEWFDRSWSLFYLSSCALHGVIPDREKLKGTDWEHLHQLSCFHSMEAITAMALEAGGLYEEMDASLACRWKEEKEKAIRKILLLDEERKKILQYFEKTGIWYMPLKGILLKEFYPLIGMRQMADNDILYDSSRRKDLLAYMKSQGFKAQKKESKTHDVYEKEPIYNFEMHWRLFGPMWDIDWESYYGNVKERLIKDDGNLQGYHFTAEDFYVYLIAHAYKHYSAGGTGVRFLMDQYVYLQAKKGTLDWSHVEQELKKLGLYKFEQDARQIGQTMCCLCRQMETNRLTHGQQQMLLYLLQSGVYGTVEHTMQKTIERIQRGVSNHTDVPVSKRKTKVMYFYRRLVPDMEYYRLYRPYLYRHRYLIPGYLIYRLFRALFTARDQVRSEIRMLRNFSEKKE